MSADEPRRLPIAPWTGVSLLHNSGSGGSTHGPYQTRGLRPQPEQIANQPEDDTLEARESEPMPTGAVGPIFTTATPTGE